MSEVAKRLRTRIHDAQMDHEHMMDDAADEIEKLEERCEAYKGQVEAGAAEIERLCTALRDLLGHADECILHGWRDENIFDAAKAALGQPPSGE